MTELDFQLWRIFSRVKHWFGLHTWVPSERWDLRNEGYLVEIVGLVCWRCPATKDL